MSLRDMWKMLHLLNNTSQPSLTTEELGSAGVDCYKDTLHDLRTGGAVTSTPDGATERWEIADAASKVLNVCTVARRLEGAGEVEVDRKRVFCVMPFSEPWSDDVWACCEGAAQDLTLHAVRGDTTLRSGGDLIANVWKEVLQCGLVVVDLSVPNPNVYYEAGMAFALGRDTIVLVQKGVDLPADLKGRHWVEYDRADLASARVDLRDHMQQWRDHNDIRADGVEAILPPLT